MEVMVRLADLEADREQLLDTFSRYLNSDYSLSRFEWAYKGNPHGQGQAWLAVDSENQQVIGAAAAFPRRLYVGEREEQAWVLGDFCIHDQYRSVGPAIQLQRACLAAINTGKIAFYYDFPSPSMMAIYRRLHIDVAGQMLRLARPLRVDRKIGELIKVPIAARGLAAASNFLLASYEHMRLKTSANVTITHHNGMCGEEFSLLACTIGGRYGVCVQRSAAYLNWRYLANPVCRYELLTMRRDGALVGYAVLLLDGDDAILVDLFGVEEPALLSSLIDAVVAILRKQGRQTISVPILDSHPLRMLLQHHGFTTREASPVVISSTSQILSTSEGQYTLPWRLMHGDRDS